MKKRTTMLMGAVFAAATLGAPAFADDTLTVHRLSAAMAMDAVKAAVDACTAQKYHESAVVVDTDGLVQASLRGDGASSLTLDVSQGKAYTAVTLGAGRGQSSAQVAERLKDAPANGIAKDPHVILGGGGLLIKRGDEVVGAIGTGGAPGGDLDEACAKAGIDKIADRLK